MSKIWPSGEIKLYNIPQSDILNGRAVAFLPGVDGNGLTERERWFEAYRIATESPVTVVKKKKNPLRVSVDIATVAQANYMSFKNPDFDNKIYYCIIKDYDYLNNNVTEIQYVIDWYYTDYYNVHFENCHMAREGLMVKEKHYLDINPYDINCCEKMRSQEALSVNSDLEMPHYDLGAIASNTYDDLVPDSIFRRGEDGGDVLIEQACQNKYGGGEAPVGNYGASTYPSDTKNKYKVYPYHKTLLNYQTQADAWNDTAPLIPCVMFSAIDFEYLDDSFPEVRAEYSNTGMSAKWLSDMETVADYETYASGTYTSPSQRFKALISYFRTKSKFYVMAFPRNAVAPDVGGESSPTLIYRTVWRTDLADRQVSDWQIKKTECLYPRPYYIMAVAPFYDNTHNPKYVNPIQEIIDLLTEWNMSSSILGVYMLPAILLRSVFAHGGSNEFGDYVLNNVVRFATSFQRKKDGYNYGNSPKLLQAPYSYLTLENSDGTSLCDYRYEDMGDKDYTIPSEQAGALKHRNEIPFGIMTEVNAGSIRMGVAPIYGKRVMKMRTAPTTEFGETFDACDLQKLVSYDCFPQAPYTTDAYMAFLSGVNSTIANESTKNNLIDIQKGLINTGFLGYSQMMSGHIEGAAKSALGLAGGVQGMGTNPDYDGLSKARDIRKETSDAYSKQAQGLGSVAGNGTGIVSGIIGTAKDYQIFGWEQKQAENLANLANSASRGALLDLKGSAVASMYSVATSAHAMRNYVSGTNGGVSATNKFGMGQRLLFVHHRLRPDVITAYDDYFVMYGYTTGKYKKPAIAIYMEEGNADASQYANVNIPYDSAQWDTSANKKAYGPQWESHNNESVFFTQCSKCYVTGVNQDSRDFIEKLFEGGCRFAKPIFPSNS